MEKTFPHRKILQLPRKKRVSRDYDHRSLKKIVFTTKNLQIWEFDMPKPFKNSRIQIKNLVPRIGRDRSHEINHRILPKMAESH